ncbi:hypothetical protein BY996DRAFT_4575004 [Phakopsora pachyrhizi]|uniref:Expressed protein n=1 Tax=Phakopsora pachyrhizi TaxID=170000 RepID=A0AAV0ADG4_PHAPC|nr:hypothetical protein BY996DRAFT_4575004 [Phakopsora pachyrhizi]CAH7666041.1 expressed protein [Phakopsora pachyrhizi]
MLISSGNRFWSGDNGPAGRARCENPYREPGSLYRHPSDGSMTSWIPLETGCLPAPNYIGMIRQAQIDLMVDGTSKKFIRDPEGLNFLRNRTILILGDSVDRNSLQHFCQLISRPIRLTTWGGSNQTDNLDHRGLPHLCRIDELDFSAVNGFHYGMDDIDLFNDPNRHPDWHSPGKFEDRLEELISPYLRSHIPGSRRKPSLVVWSSGLWDVAFFGTEDERRNSSFHSALDRGRLDWWMSRARQTITSTRHHFPDSLLVMRMMHRVNGDSEETGWMQDVRVHQIREAQSELAREVDFFEVLDFGTIFEGYQQYQEKVHPLPNPGSIIFQAYLHYLKLAVQYDLI